MSVYSANAASCFRKADAGVPDIVPQGWTAERSMQLDMVFWCCIHDAVSVLLHLADVYLALPWLHTIMQVWTAERSTQLGMAVSSMLKGYTTTAAQIITAMLKSVTKFTIQVCDLGSDGVNAPAVPDRLRMLCALRTLLPTSQTQQLLRAAMHSTRLVFAATICCTLNDCGSMVLKTHASCTWLLDHRHSGANPLMRCPALCCTHNAKQVGVAMIFGFFMQLCYVTAALRNFHALDCAAPCLVLNRLA
jgi:hypothetical protein